MTNIIQEKSMIENHTWKPFKEQSLIFTRGLPTLDGGHKSEDKHVSQSKLDGKGPYESTVFNSYQPERSVGQNQKKKSVDLTSAYLSF